jgi:hypothetical protein
VTNPRDATYLIEGEPFSLQDGQATVETFPGAASQTLVQFHGEPVFGDLNGMYHVMSVTPDLLKKETQ